MGIVMNTLYIDIHNKVSTALFVKTRFLVEGINDLVSSYPEILNIWDKDNNDVRPNEICYFPTTHTITYVIDTVNTSCGNVRHMD